MPEILVLLSCEVVLSEDVAVPRRAEIDVEMEAEVGFFIFYCTY